MRSHRIPPSLLLLTGLLTACSGSSSGGTTPTTVTGTNALDVMVTGTGDGGLFALSAPVSEVVLVSETGERTANLMPTTMEMEFVGLDQRTEYLTRGSVPPGTYVCAEVRFDETAMRALDVAGQVAPLVVTDATWSAELDQPLTVGGGATVEAPLLLELDLDASVTPDPGTGAMLFEAQGMASGTVTTVLPVETFQGLVLESSLLDRSVTVEVFLRSGHMLGLVEVLVADDTELLDLLGRPYPDSAAFFTDLSVGNTVLEVTAELDLGGTVTARELRVVDQGGLLPATVELDGRILSLDTGAGQFVLLVRDVHLGWRHLSPHLGPRPLPFAVTIAWNGATRFQLPDGQAATSDDLMIGIFVRVHLSSFDQLPLVADGVQILDPDRCLAGTIADLSGLPDEVVIRVPGLHLGQLIGRPAADRTLSMGISEAELLLRVAGRPELDTAQLDVGQRVVACSPFDDLGTPAEPAYDLNKLTVAAGRLHDALLESIDPSGRLTVRGGVPSQLGESSRARQITIVPALSAHYIGRARSADELRTLFDELGPGELLEIDARHAVYSGTPGEIIARQIQTRIVGRR